MALSKMHMRVLKARPLTPGRFVFDLESDPYDFTRIEARIAMSEEPVVGKRGRYGWEGPNKADKGQRNGSCNRTACQEPGAYWWNRGSRSWYCSKCAGMINECDPELLCVLDEQAYQEFWHDYAHGSGHEHRR